MRNSWFAAVVCACALAACGDDSARTTAREACPTVDGDRHVDEATSSPGGFPVMLHVVGRACAHTGENNFQLYPTDDDGALAPALEPAHGDEAHEGAAHAITLTRVTARMPAMGHGAAEAPAVIGDDTLTVTFQMPGDWEIDVAYADAATTTPQTARFRLTVQ